HQCRDWADRRDSMTNAENISTLHSNARSDGGGKLEGNSESAAMRRRERGKTSGDSPDDPMPPLSGAKDLNALDDSGAHPTGARKQGQPDNPMLPQYGPEDLTPEAISGAPPATLASASVPADVAAVNGPAS